MSTRRVDDLIKALGCDGISSSQVSRIQQLDEVVESFLGRPLDGGPYPYAVAGRPDAEGAPGRPHVNDCVVVATGAPKGSVRSWVWTTQRGRRLLARFPEV